MPKEVKLVLSLQFIASMAYLQILPFYPSFLRKKKIDGEYLGFIMAVFSVFFILSAYITGKWLLNKIKRITGCYLGAILVIINILGLGSLYPLKNGNFILGLTFLFQMLGGIGNGINTTSTLAILTSYKEMR